MDESFGPNALDCPQRLLKAVADYAPPNEYAAEWRRRALARHAQARAVRQLLGEILEDYPHGDPRLVVRGEVVRYQRARQSGRPRHAYRKADGELWGLNEDSVDLAATERGSRPAATCRNARKGRVADQVRGLSGVTSRKLV